MGCLRLQPINIGRLESWKNFTIYSPGIWMILDVHGLNQTAPFFHFKPFKKVQRLGPRSRNRSKGGGCRSSGEKMPFWITWKIKMRQVIHWLYSFPLICLHTYGFLCRKQTSYVFPLGDETWTKKNDDTSQVCLGNIYQYPPSCCIWRKPKLSLQRLWMLRMLRMLHWLHRLQLHRWLMNGWCMLQWLWHWLHWLGHWLRHWLRHRLPSMNLSRCCLIARVDWTHIKTWQFGWPCLVRCKNSKWIQDLGGKVSKQTAWCWN